MLTESKHPVATTILQQLGGRRFIAMTGSYQFVATETALTMKLRRNNLQAQYLKIELTVMDTYTMKFISFNKKQEMIVKDVVEGVYNDMLQDIFTSKTGLYTHL